MPSLVARRHPFKLLLYIFLGRYQCRTPDVQNTEWKISIPPPGFKPGSPGAKPSMEHDAYLRTNSR